MPCMAASPVAKRVVTTLDNLSQFRHHHGEKISGFVAWRSVICFLHLNWRRLMDRPDFPVRLIA